MRLDSINNTGNSKVPTIRMARLPDLDDIVEIVISAFRQDPQWCYRFPHAAKYMCDHRRYTRLRYLEYFESVKSGVCTLMVAEMPDKHKPRTRKVVAFSLWQMPGRHGIIGAASPNTTGKSDLAQNTLLPLLFTRRLDERLFGHSYRMTVNRVNSKIGLNLSEIQ